MRGATAEPLENTIKKPNSSKAKNTGTSQYFFRANKKRKNSPINPIRPSKTDRACWLFDRYFRASMIFEVY